MLLLLFTTVILVLGAVGIHLQALILLTAWLRWVRRARVWVGVAVIFSIAAHALEIGLFALGYYLIVSEESGMLYNSLGQPSHDYFYFSATVYTTVGFGDIVPVGPVRILTAVEALTGLVLIAWTASFLLMEMQRMWKPQ